MRKSPEVQKAMAAVIDTARHLKTHHYAWIVTAALEHFREQVARTENEILRHERFKDEPYVEAGCEHRGEETTRQSKSQALRLDLDTYRNLVRFLLALKELVSWINAEEFASDMRNFFREERKRKPTKKS